MITDIHAAPPPLGLPLRCRCGHVRGVARAVSPSAGFRFICYCQDCQAFARFLERPDVLAAAGGTDIFQMPPARMKLTAGTDALRCLSLSRKVFRWYTDCCRTPVVNTAAGPRFPVVAVIHSFMDREFDGHSGDEMLGPRCAVSTKAPPSARSRRSRRRDRPSASSRAAHRRFSAGGCRGSLSRTHSSTISPALRALCRSCSSETGAQVPFNRAAFSEDC